MWGWFGGRFGRRGRFGPAGPCRRGGAAAPRGAGLRGDAAGVAKPGPGPEPDAGHGAGPGTAGPGVRPARGPVPVAVDAAAGRRVVRRSAVGAALHPVDGPRLPGRGARVLRL